MKEWMSGLLAQAAAGLVLLASAYVVHAEPVADPLQRPAAPAVQPARQVMLGLAQAGKRAVAVGERGLILLSDDDGRHWRQAASPVSVTLTAVSFPSPRQGWAVGHSGVVLHTEDGGEHWKRQLDGHAIIALLKQAADAAPVDAALAAVAAQFAADGADKPLLDVQFSDGANGWVVGAYGLLLRTTDGGRSWQPLMQCLDNPKGLHLYALAVQGDTVWVAGEQGMLARSGDGGQHFERIQAPYRGTFFTLSPLADGGVLLGGLKGTALRVSAAGDRFEPVTGLQPVSLSATLTLRDGRHVYANQAGQLYIGAGLGAARLAQRGASLPLSALLQTPDGALLAAGAHGVDRVVLQGDPQ
ncbi:WD40/YVTN/BNR-like repeat-containing protein [Oxalobacteraceae bacterium A2-2]